MADKSVGELIAATSVTPTDLFVLEQNGTAKKLTGQALENWLVSFADGHGGIQTIEKVGTDVLADTYRITLADTTTFDFVVTNGKGIGSIKKTSTSGLVDTYTIGYNDGTSGTFTVTNGAKGDPGDNAYLWIKYASQEPTAISNSFGDLPDDWIGVYFGFSSTAPTDWQEYTWFKIKGETGKTGSASVLNSGVTTYQASDSGTIIPSGTWLASIPPVSQGKYLWTRTVLTFNTGLPVTSYSVARMGVDGAGSVVSVNNVSPDGNGNVAIDAKSIGALSLSGGTMTGPVHMNGQTLDGLNSPTETSQAATKGYADRYANASNISSGTLGVARLPTVPISKGGTGATTAAQAVANLGLTKKYASANGSASSLSIPQYTITPLTLDTWKVKSDDSFMFSGGGIKVPSNGTVLICAGIYFDTSTNASPENLGVYVKQNGTEVSGQLTYSQSSTVSSLSPFLLTVAAGDVLTLCARNVTKAGACQPNGGATALTVIYL